MELALGTVQFGMRYGVAGRDTAVPEPEVRSILTRASALGIRWLDTAAAYGDIESRLARLSDGLGFRIVTKLPPLPEGLTASDATSWVDSTLQQSTERLGDSLQALMFHRADDLLGPLGEALWARCAKWVAARGCTLGVSCYDTVTLNRIAARFPVAIAQLPGNALDQRLHSEPIATAGIAIHLRSAFLQGLLLMQEAQAARRVPAATAALARWHAWCCEQGVTPLVGALSVVKAMPGVTHCVVGVDDQSQLEAIAAAWQTATPRPAPELQTADLAVIDPRQWPLGPVNTKRAAA